MELLWEKRPRMMTEGMVDPTRTEYTGVRTGAHHHRPHHLHQTGQLHRSMPVRCFGHQ
jgi:hypothetical protein